MTAPATLDAVLDTLPVPVQMAASLYLARMTPERRAQLEADVAAAALAWDAGDRATLAALADGYGVGPLATQYLARMGADGGD